jgi:cytidylate kinase
MWIIAFSGLPQTGKTTLARRLAKELKCKFVSFGDFVRQEAVRRGIEKPTRRDLQDLGQALVTEDLLAFCRHVLETVKFSPGEQIVLDGVRHKEVLEAVANLSPAQPIKLIYLVASIGVRRARSPRNVDLASIDSHEVESHIEKDLRALADLVIDTEGDADESFHRLISWIRAKRAFE